MDKESVVNIHDAVLILDDAATNTPPPHTSASLTSSFAVAIPVEDTSSSKKQGSMCCGCCCDHRMATIILAIIRLIFLSILVKNLLIESVRWSDELFVMIVYISMTICSLVGAIKYSICLVAIDLLWCIGKYYTYRGWSLAVEVLGHLAISSFPVDLGWWDVKSLFVDTNFCCWIVCDDSTKILLQRASWLWPLAFLVIVAQQWCKSLDCYRAQVKPQPTSQMGALSSWLQGLLDSRKHTTLIHFSLFLFCFPLWQSWHFLYCPYGSHHNHYHVRSHWVHPGCSKGYHDDPGIPIKINVLWKTIFLLLYSLLYYYHSCCCTRSLPTILWRNVRFIVSLGLRLVLENRGVNDLRLVFRIWWEIKRNLHK